MTTKNVTIKTTRRSFHSIDFVVHPFHRLLTYRSPVSRLSNVHWLNWAMKKMGPWWFLGIRGIILPSYVWIIVYNLNYKDPYQTINIMESKAFVFFSVAQLDASSGWLVGHLNDIFTPRSRERYRGKLSLLYQPLGKNWFTAPGHPGSLSKYLWRCIPDICGIFWKERARKLCFMSWSYSHIEFFFVG